MNDPILIIWATGALITLVFGVALTVAAYHDGKDDLTRWSARVALTAPLWPFWVLLALAYGYAWMIRRTYR